MKKMLIALGLCAALGVQAAILVNGSFEDTIGPEWSTFDSWSGTYPNGYGTTSPFITDPARARIISDNGGSFLPYVGPSTARPGGDSGGQYFLKVTTGAAGQYQGVSQFPVTISGPSDLIYGWYAIGNASSVAEVNLVNLSLSSVGRSVYSGTTPFQWQEWSFTGLPAGNYILHFVTTGPLGSVGYFDMSAVPEPRGWLMGGALLGMLGVGEFLRRRRAQKTNA